jgi:hypothetical protein
LYLPREAAFRPERSPSRAGFLEMMTDHLDRRASQGDGAVFFIALLSTALALGPALAHAFELPNKIGLPQADYFTVQQIYAGWNRLAIVLAIELASMLALAVMSRRRPEVFWPVLLAIMSLACAQAIFWVFTYPANVATGNWTSVPADWQMWRVRWEYSHLAGAVFQILAISALIVAALRRGLPAR